MNKQPRARRQHTAAKSYLLGFADSSSQVCMHARDGTVELRSIRSATVRRDFYTFVDATGRPNESIERWLGGQVENDVAGVLKDLRAGQPLQNDHIDLLALFVATSLMRTATVRSYMAQIDAGLRPLLVAMERAKSRGINLADQPSSKREKLLAETARAIAQLNPDAIQEQNSRLRTMLREIDQVRATLRSWNWELTQASSPCLITADAPVAVLQPTASSGWGGVLPKGSSAFLPISPVALLTASPNPLIGPAKVTDQLARQVNSELVRNAHRAAYHHPQVQWPLDLAISPQSPTLPQPRITWNRSDPDQAPTFPATYPPIIDPAIAALLGDLGAEETVE